MQYPYCFLEYLDCVPTERNLAKKALLAVTKVVKNCDPRESSNDFGMFADAFTSQVATANFRPKYFYCLWFGLRSLRYIHMYVLLI